MGMSLVKGHQDGQGCGAHGLGGEADGAVLEKTEL